MRLYLRRYVRGADFTIGKLSIDDVEFCDILEDVVRDPGVKIYGKTAIPEGVYTLDITWSKRFQRMLPLIVNVPMFEGIRIHPGNTAANTDGCLLPGRFDGDHSVINSKKTFDRLYPLLVAANRPIVITIKNDFP